MAATSPPSVMYASTNIAATTIATSNGQPSSASMMIREREQVDARDQHLRRPRS